jgi:hypothetical protein
MTDFCSGPVRRRSFLQAGAAAFTGLGMADLLRLQAQAGQDSSDTAVIFCGCRVVRRTWKRST